MPLHPIQIIMDSWVDFLRTVKNLEIWNSYIDGSASSYSGELVLLKYGYSFVAFITNVRLSRPMATATDKIPGRGLFGFSHGSTISNCIIVSSSVNGQGNVIGGLVDLDQYAISNCTSSATVIGINRDNWNLTVPGNCRK